MRILLLGNAGSGKTTMARRLMDCHSLAYLSLDEIAWAEGIVRRPIAESLQCLQKFMDHHAAWIIEGCYGELMEFALPYCTELRFLNPGVDVCVEHCRCRAWEPSKFQDEAEQRASLTSLIAWVREYETRDDEFGLKWHRRLFQRFSGVKKEYTSLEMYPSESLSHAMSCGGQDGNR